MPPPPDDPYGSMPAYDPSRYGPIATQFEYGGRWRRLGAAIIDNVLVGVVTGILTAPFGTWNNAFDTHSTFEAKQAFGNLVTGVLGFLYYWLLHARWGQTLGKRLLNIRVVRADDGGAIGYGQSAWREIFEWLLAFITCGIGFFVDNAWILWDERRQALHDKVAKTVVVKAEPGMPNPYERR